VASRAAVIGAGPMGLWLTKYLKARGYGVAVYDRNQSRARAAANALKTDMAKTLDEAVGEAELTVLAVGAENAGPLLSGLLKRYSGKVYVDISSVKAPILKFLPRQTPSSQVVLTHPLFGPGAKTLKDKVVVVTPVYRRQAEVSIAKKLFNPCKIVSMNPREHDVLMAYAMAAPRVAVFSVLELWRKHRIKPLTTSQKALLAAASTMLADSWKITGQIVAQNPYTKKALGELINKIKQNQENIHRMPTATHQRLASWIRPKKFYGKVYKIIEENP
jgi:prephenate dehydrogenase